MRQFGVSARSIVLHRAGPLSPVPFDRSLSASLRCSFVPFPTAHALVVWWCERSKPLVAMNTTTSVHGSFPGLWIFNDQGS